MEMITGYLLSPANPDSVLIWDVDDAIKLRSDHRIMGSFIGALPSQPKQNGCLGLPLKLLPEETTLLLEQKLLHLRSYEDVLSNCTQHDLSKISRELKEEDRERQLRDYLAKRDQSGYKTTDAKSFSPLVAIHTTDPPDETHSLDENRLNVSWNWPTTDEQMLKCKVFSDLWHKGYYLTSGLKYGGDYLAYPDDPIACHSHYIVKIFSWRENFSPLCLIQHGRLGNNVKKNILFCSAKPDGTLKYYTLHWSGF